MSTQTQRARTGEFLLAEANGSLSREQVTFAATEAIIPAGTVVAQITAGGEWVPYDPDADPVDGSEVAAGILYAELPVAIGDQPGVVIVRHAEVAEAALTGIDAAAKTALAALQIIVR